MRYSNFFASRVENSECGFLDGYLFLLILFKNISFTLCSISELCEPKSLQRGIRQVGNALRTKTND